MVITQTSDDSPYRQTKRLSVLWHTVSCKVDNVQRHSSTPCTKSWRGEKNTKTVTTVEERAEPITGAPCHDQTTVLHASNLKQDLRRSIPKTSECLYPINNLTNTMGHSFRLCYVINTSFLYGCTLHVLWNLHNKLFLSWDLESQPRLASGAWQPATSKKECHTSLFTTGNIQPVKCETLYQRNRS